MLSMRVGTAQPFRASSRAPARAILTPVRPAVATSSAVLSGLCVGQRDDGAFVCNWKGGREACGAGEARKAGGDACVIACRPLTPNPPPHVTT
jgi:hypothetical protein